MSMRSHSVVTCGSLSRLALKVKATEGPICRFFCTIYLSPVVENLLSVLLLSLITYGSYVGKPLTDVVNGVIVIHHGLRKVP